MPASPKALGYEENSAGSRRARTMPTMQIMPALVLIAHGMLEFSGLFGILNNMNRVALLVIFLFVSGLAGLAQTVQNKAYKAPALSATAKDEIAKATRAIKIAPTAENYCERGRLYGKNKHYKEAVPDHSRAIELDPNNAFYWFARGGDYGNLGEWNKGISDATKALSLSKKGDSIYINALRIRGHCYYKSGRQKLADADATALDALGAL